MQRIHNLRAAVIKRLPFFVAKRKEKSNDRKKRYL